MRWEFWKWLFCGLNDRPGFLQLIDWWFPFHVVIGLVLAKVVDMSLHEAAQTFLLPLAGIFIGLSFAWVGTPRRYYKQVRSKKLPIITRTGFAPMFIPFN